MQEAYLTLLDLSVALQMISYLYLFACLVRRAFARNMGRVYFGRAVLRLASAVGFGMTGIGFFMAFIPAHQISSIWSFELKMLITLAALLGLAGVLFRYYSLQRPAPGPQEIIPT